MTTQELQTSFGQYRTIAIIGGQFGDEAKGKFVDVMSENVDIVARGTGGANAGHTINAHGKQTILHLVPSGILRDGDGVTTICGNGMVIDPGQLISELEDLEEAGISHKNLRIAQNASLVLPQHILEDRLSEVRAGKVKIGTTGRGIGPAYVDRVARVGLRMNDLLNPDVFLAKLMRNLEDKNRWFKTFDQDAVIGVLDRASIDRRLYTAGGGFNPDEIAAQFAEYHSVLGELIADTDELMREKLACDQSRILLEGAQGELLGIDGGTYPFVTSSDCSVAGLAKGVGLQARDVELTVIVAKAFYMTRVGGGPFPTEFGGIESEGRCNDPGTNKDSELKFYPNASVNSANEYEQGVGIRRAGNEYGATTGRPRRTGWLDLPLLRHTVRRTGGEVVLALAKLDVLDECERIRLCVGYRYDGPEYRLGQRTIRTGDTLNEAVVISEVLKHCRPIYEDYDGWCSPTRDITNYHWLPKNLRTLVGAVEREARTKVKFVSVGPDRDQTILLD